MRKTRNFQMKIKELLNSQHIKVSAIGSLAIKFLSAFFAFLSGIILARLLGLEGFGFYTLAFTTVTLLSVPVALGLPTLITRYISKYQVVEDYSAIKGLLIRTNQMVYISSLVILLIAVVSYFLWWKNLNSVLVETIWYSLMLLPLMGLGSLRAAALRGMRFIILGQLPDTLLRNFLLCFGIGIFYLLDYGMTPQLAMQIHIAAALIAYICGYIFLRKKLHHQTKYLKPTFSNKEWFKQALPFSINSGIQIIKSKLVIYVLAIFGSIEAVALFDIALRGAALVAFTLDALNTAIAPYISNAFEKKNMESLQRIVTKTSRLIFVFALPVVLIFIFGGEPLLAFVFGKEFVLSYVPLVILCIGQLVNAATGSVGLVLSMTGHQKYITKVLSLITVLNILFCIPLVIYFDVLGASLIYSGLIIVQNLILVVYVKNNLKINTTIF